MTRNGRLIKRRKMKLNQLRSHYRENLMPVMQEAAESAPLLSGIPYLMLTSSSQGVPEEYRNLLEAETIGRLITYFMDTGRPRDSILEITAGSVLGEALKEMFEWIDENLTESDYQDLYACSLHAIDDALRLKIQELEIRKTQLEQEEKAHDHYYDIASDDLPF